MRTILQVKDVNINKQKPKETLVKPAPKKQEYVPLVMKPQKGKKRAASDETTVEDSVLNEVDVDKDSELKKDLFSFEEDPEDFFKNSYVLTMTQRVNDGEDLLEASDFDITRLEDMSFELCPEVEKYVIFYEI